MCVQDPHDDIHEPGPILGNANRLPRRPPAAGSPDAACTNSAEGLQTCPGDTGAAGSGVLVSIVLPLFNAAEFLDECMQSIAAQTHRPLEVAAYDNRSTDASAELLRQWRPRLEAAGLVVVVAATGADDPRGCGYARNRCIEVASGALWSRSSLAPCDFMMWTSHLIEV